MMSHQSVMLQESINALNINPDGVYIDATFGRGGHSLEILKNLGKSGKLIAIDKDLSAIDMAKELINQYPQMSIHHTSFANLSSVVNSLGLSNKVDGILMDLGVSSPQLDDSTRGFSFMHDGPLDMRMDNSSGISASEWVNTASEVELANVIYKYGEEKKSRAIAKQIVSHRKNNKINTTFELVEIIKKVIPWQPNKHPATRTFQALRIFINKEIDDLEKALSESLNVLKEQARLVVISFHSLEDRIVKQFINKHSKPPANDSRIPFIVEVEPKLNLKKIGKFIKPTSEECKDNIRARSAIMRVAEKL